MKDKKYDLEDRLIDFAIRISVIVETLPNTKLAKALDRYSDIVINNNNTKVCTKCDKRKPIDEFYKKKGLFIFEPICIGCSKIKKYKHRQKNKEKHSVYMKEYFKEYKKTDSYKDNQCRYRKENRHIFRARERHRECIKARAIPFDLSKEERSETEVCCPSWEQAS